MTADDLTAALLDQLASLAAGVAELRVRTTALETVVTGGSPGDADADSDGIPSQDAYEPAPPRRWWKLTGPDRDDATGPLRAWASQVLQPGYGKLAAGIGDCWDQHDACLYAADILVELWSVLYLSTPRTPALLSAQAEYQARILPALTAQMTAETTGCHHQLPGAHDTGTGVPR